jgi:hypothetical protein
MKYSALRGARPAEVLRHWSPQATRERLVGAFRPGCEARFLQASNRTKWTREHQPRIRNTSPRPLRNLEIFGPPLCIMRARSPGGRMWRGPAITPAGCPAPRCAARAACDQAPCRLPPCPPGSTRHLQPVSDRQIGAPVDRVAVALVLHQRQLRLTQRFGLGDRPITQLTIELGHQDRGSLVVGSQNGLVTWINQRFNAPSNISDASRLSYSIFLLP